MTTETARPLVSVVIPAYNAEAYLGATIESVLAQTYRPIEIIVVDDGSSDGTVALARSFGDPVRVLEQDNRGPAGARNTGFAAVRGEIIALLDADDLWLPERLDACVTLLRSDPAIGFVTTDAYLIDEDTPTERRYYTDYQRFPFPAPADQLAEIAKRNFLFVSVVFERTLFERAGARLDESLWGTEDYELWTRFLLAGSRAALVPEPLAYYRVRAGSVSRARARQWQAHLAVLERHLPSLWRLGATGRPQDEYEIGIQVARRGGRRLALPFLLHSLRDPGVRFGLRARYALRGAWALALGTHAGGAPSSDAAAPAAAGATS
ncbi:MAG: glycosyltransferase family 2 protein [Actinomycetes bacterium]